MLLESMPNQEISYYGKKTYYLNEELATKISPEQVSKNFMYEDFRDNKLDMFH